MQDADNAVRKGHWSLIARIMVATVAILWVLRGQDWHTLAAVFQRLSPWYFGFSLVIYAAAQVVIAVRWWLLLRAQGIHIETAAAVRLFFLGLFYNNLMPGSVGGDLLKAWYVTKHTQKRLEGVLSVFVDRVIGLVGIILMATFTYMAFVWGRMPIGGGAEKTVGPQHRGVILWAALAVGAAVLAVLVHPAGRARLAHAVARLRSKGVEALGRVKDAVAVYCSRPWTLLGALGLTFVSQSTVIVGFWLLGRNLGIEAGLRYYFVIFPIMWVVGAVPISIAGLGILEGGIVGLFSLLTGTPRELATALALCQRFVWVLASLPGGLVHLLGAHLPEREISIDGQERTN